MALTIVKASGQQEEFRTEKLVTSLIRSGASPDVAEEIADRIRKSIEPYATTRQIYRLAKTLLRRRNHLSLVKYSLKQAISSLGPSGFPFEKYFARVLARYGYSVQTNQMVLGRCVKHEVDILANREGEYSMIECKYHTNGG
ncbi:MAG: ATP cone domain-containing protein, partial [bacterium]